MSERMCIVCGRMTTAQRHETPEGCPRPECCILDMTAEEAWLYWRKVAHAPREELASLRRAEASHSPNSVGGYSDPEKPETEQKQGDREQEKGTQP